MDCNIPDQPKDLVIVKRVKNDKGETLHEPYCRSMTPQDCSATQIFKHGICRTMIAADCSLTEVFENQKCRPRTKADCRPGERFENGLCKLFTQRECPGIFQVTKINYGGTDDKQRAYDLDEGLCTPLTAGDCPGGYNVSTGRCEGHCKKGEEVLDLAESYNALDQQRGTIRDELLEREDHLYGRYACRKLRANDCHEYEYFENGKCIRRTLVGVDESCPVGTLPMGTVQVPLSDVPLTFSLRNSDNIIKNIMRVGSMQQITDPDKAGSCETDGNCMEVQKISNYNALIRRVRLRTGNEILATYPEEGKVYSLQDNWLRPSHTSQQNSAAVNLEQSAAVRLNSNWTCDKDHYRPSTLDISNCENPDYKSKCITFALMTQTGSSSSLPEYLEYSEMFGRRRRIQVPLEQAKSFCDGQKRYFRGVHDIKKTSNGLCQFINIRPCTPLTQCAPHEAEIKAPTAYTDRQCGCDPEKSYNKPKFSKCILDTAYKSEITQNGYCCWPEKLDLSENECTGQDRHQFRKAYFEHDEDGKQKLVEKYTHRSIPRVRVYDGYTCEPLTQCTNEEYEKGAPTKERTKDRVCTPLTQCGTDQVETKAPTATTDRQCGCTEGQYKKPRVGVYDGFTCEPFTQCTDNEYEKEAPTPDKDRVCAPLTQCMNGLETKAPTATTDRQCKSVETAKDLETYLVQQAQLKLKTDSIPANTYVELELNTDHVGYGEDPLNLEQKAVRLNSEAKCGENEYHSVTIEYCNADNNDDCEPDGRMDPYQYSLVTASKGKRVEPDGTYSNVDMQKIVVPLAMANCEDNEIKAYNTRTGKAIKIPPYGGTSYCNYLRVKKFENGCKPLSDCGEYEHEVAAPTATSDRKCSQNVCTCRNGAPEVTQCKKHQSEQCASCNAGYELLENQCTLKCTESQYKKPIYSKCVLDPAYKSKLTDGRRWPDELSYNEEECTGAWPGFSDYEVPRVRVYDGYTCEPFTQCTDDEYEKEAPTPDKDRVCAPLTQCMNGLETKAPTATTDRQCKSVETAKDLETYLVQQAQLKLKTDSIPANAYVELELKTDHVGYGEDPLKQAGDPQKSRKFVTQMGRANNRRFYGPVDNLEYRMRKETSIVDKFAGTQDMDARREFMASNGRSFFHLSRETETKKMCRPLVATDCTAAQKFINGACVALECQEPLVRNAETQQCRVRVVSDCSATQVLEEGKCRDRTAADCSGVQIFDKGLCRAQTAADCSGQTSYFDTLKQVCRAPRNDSECPNTDMTFDNETFSCVPKPAAPTTCAQGYTLVEKVCVKKEAPPVSPPNTICTATQRFDGTQCVALTAADCFANQVFEGGRCVAKETPQTPPQTPPQEPPANACASTNDMLMSRYLVVDSYSIHVCPAGSLIQAPTTDDA